MKRFFRWDKLAITLGLILLNNATLFAQTTPCDLDDLDDPTACSLPLDNWVYFLVLVAVVYGAYRMYQKQKALAV